MRNTNNSDRTVLGKSWFTTLILRFQTTLVGWRDRGHWPDLPSANPLPPLSSPLNHAAHHTVSFVQWRWHLKRQLSMSHTVDVAGCGRMWRDDAGCASNPLWRSLCHTQSVEAHKAAIHLQLLCFTGIVSPCSLPEPRS